MNGKDISKRLIFYHCFILFGILFAVVIQKIYENYFRSNTLIFVIISNIVQLISYIALYKINYSYKISLILRIILTVFSISSQSFNNRIIYIVCIFATNILSIFIEFYFIKGIIDIFKCFGEEAFCKKWDFILYATMVYIIPKSILNIVSIFNIQYEKCSFAITVFSFIVLLLGMFAITYDLIYKVKSIIFLWKTEKQL